jgi:hypothetical protein
MAAPPLTAEPLLTSAHVLTALRQAEKPLTLPELQRQFPKALKATTEHIQALLDAEIAAGHAYAFANKKSPLYWHSSPADWVKNRIMYYLQPGMKLQSEVVNSVVKLVTVSGSVSKAAVQSIFKQLKDQKEILTYPSLLGAHKSQFGIKPVDPQDYVKDALIKLQSKLNVPLELLVQCAVDAAPTMSPASTSPVAQEKKSDSETDISAADLATLFEITKEAMVDLNPRVETGDMVTVTSLRQQLEMKLPTKSKFDAVMLRLAEAHKITMHKFDHPFSGHAHNLETFVCDESNNYYNTVSLRRNA